MSLKRKAEDDYSLPPKRTLLETSAPNAAADHDAFIQTSKRSMDVDLAPVGTPDYKPKQSEQQRVPLSSCTDLVVYQPPVLESLVKAAAQPAIPPILLGNGHTAGLQQPNAMALVLRSLTPEQRAGLRGMWDVLRDQKVLQGMLRQLPSHAQYDDPDDAAAGVTDSSRSADDARHQDTHCTIEELNADSKDHNAPEPPPPAAAARTTGEVATRAAAQTVFSALPFPMQQTAPAGSSSAIANQSALQPQHTAVAPHCVWQQGDQQQQHAWPYQQHSLPLHQQQQQQLGNSDTLMLAESEAGELLLQQQQQQQAPVAVADHAAPMELDM